MFEIIRSSQSGGQAQLSLSGPHDQAWNAKYVAQNEDDVGALSHSQATTSLTRICMTALLRHLWSIHFTALLVMHNAYELCDSLVRSRAVYCGL